MSRYALAAAAAAILITALVLPAGALADTYCVNQGGCDLAHTFSSVQPALNAAQANGGGNTVEIGPGTYTGPFTYTMGTNPVTITGAGTGQTILTTSSSAVVLRLDGGFSSVVSKLTLALPEGVAAEGLRLTSGGTANGIAVSQASSGNQSSTGVELNGSATLENSSLLLPVNNSGTTTVGVYAGLLAPCGCHMHDLTIRADDGISQGSGQTATVTNAQRLNLVGGSIGVSVRDGSLTLDDSLIRLADPSSAAARYGVSVQGTNGAAPSFSGNQLTILGNSEGQTFGVQSFATGAGSSAVVRLDNTIIRSFQTALDRFTSGGAASLAIAYSDFDPAGDVDLNNAGGTGAITPGLGNINLDPMFAAQVLNNSDPAKGDFGLSAGSMAIDAGDPAPLGAIALDPSESSTDLRGNPRIVNGGSGTARRDMGAYEFSSHGPPPTGPTATTNAASSLTTRSARLNGAVAPGSAPATVHFEYATGTGSLRSTPSSSLSAGSATPVSASISGLSPGTVYRFRVVAVGSGISADGAFQAFKTLEIPAPALTGLRISPAALVAATSGPSASAARTPPSKAGATVRYTLNEAGAVRFTVTQKSVGRRGKGGRCGRQLHANRHGRRCALTVTLRGGFTVKSKAGPNRIHFGGRLGSRALRPGSYILVAVPSASGRRGRGASARFRIVRPARKRKHR